MRRSTRSITMRSSARSTRSPPPSRTTSWRFNSTSPRPFSPGSSATRRRATAAARRRCRTHSPISWSTSATVFPPTSICSITSATATSNHRHVVEPTDMADMVEFANRVSRQIARPIQLIHMPVPRNRSDDAYFAPLQRLELRPETELCLGLVHHTDGVEGAKRAAGRGEKIRRAFFHRHRMRLRPARSKHDC